MATLLLLVIYLAFIGLGVPDSLLGTAWPVIYPEFSIPLSFASIVSILTSLSTMISSMNSARVIRRFGTGRVTAFSTLLTALALLLYSFTGNFLFMCLMAIPLGLGAGCVDAALNNYVSLHYSATVMSFLHCFYGVGVMASPYIMSTVISGPAGWRGGYRTASMIQLGIAAVMFLTLPLWKKAHGEESVEAEKNMQVLPIAKTIRIPGALLTCIAFLSFCAIEAICGGWSATYMVSCKAVPPETAALASMFFYMGMALGRFLSGVVATKWRPWRVIALSTGVLGVALALLLISPSAEMSMASLMLIGLGIGPLYPIFNHLTPRHFGMDVSQSVMGMQMTFASIGCIGAPTLCGLLGQLLGMWVFPVYLMLFFVLTLLAMLWLRQVLRKEGKLA